MALSTPTDTPVFDLKSTGWTLTAVRLHVADPAEIQRALTARFGDTPGLFDDDPVVLDLSPLRSSGDIPDFPRLIRLLEGWRMRPLAVQGAGPEQLAAAREAGLVEAMASAPPTLIEPAMAPMAPVAAPVAPPPVAAEPVAAVAPPDAARPTLLIDKPLRSGQRVYARGSDLIVRASVNFGAEVIADGHIHVYGALRGRAIAGARGDTAARIFSTCMEPQLVAIAGIYRAVESPWAPQVWAKAAQVRLDGERLHVDPLTD